MEEPRERSSQAGKMYWEDLEEKESCWRAASTSRPRSRSCPSPAIRPAGAQADANGADGAKVKRYRYGSLDHAVSKVAAGGKLLFLTIDVDGCEQLRDNPAVDAYIVHIDTSTPELLRERIKQRLKVDESIVQRMLTDRRTSWC